MVGLRMQGVCRVFVLRVLTKEEIQKLADRTRKIRESRGEFVNELVKQALLTDA